MLKSAGYKQSFDEINFYLSVYKHCFFAEEKRILYS